MSVELISVLVAVLAIGATLAGVILTSNRGLQGESRLREDMREDMKQGESRLREDMGKLGHGCETTPVGCETTSSN